MRRCSTLDRKLVKVRTEAGAFTASKIQYPTVYAVYTFTPVHFSHNNALASRLDRKMGNADGLQEGNIIQRRYGSLCIISVRVMVLDAEAIRASGKALLYSHRHGCSSGSYASGLDR